MIYLTKTTVKDVISEPSSIFRTHGLHEYIRNNNGAAFASRGLKGITYWLQHNRDVERMKSPKSHILPTKIEKDELNHF